MDHSGESRQPMSPVDHMWLRMDDPTNLMMITGILLFEEPLDRARVVEVLQTRLLSIPRFRHRVVPRDRGSRHCWEPEPALDLNWHVQEASLSPPGDDQALREFVSRWMSTPLERARPLWQVHLIRNYGRGSAILWRVHHCIGDGIALMLTLLSLTDLGSAEESESETSAGDQGNPLRALFGSEPPSAQEAKEHLRRVLPEAVKLLTAPAEKLGGLNRWQRTGAVIPALARLTFRPPDSKTGLKGGLGAAKRAAWSEAIPMSEVAMVRQALGGTVNDVLTNAVAGGLRRYLEQRGGLRNKLKLRAVVPVNLRPLEELQGLGNRFGLVFLSLPVGIRDPRRRLAELHRRMSKLKRSFEPVVALRIMAALGMAPERIQDLVARIFGTKGTAVLTNVPGPVEQLRFAGRTIAGFMFWVPQAARLGMGISILSYAGQVRVGVATDEGLVPDPGAIVSGFHQEFRAMRRLAETQGPEPAQAGP